MHFIYKTLAASHTAHARATIPVLHVHVESSSSDQGAR